MAANMAVTFRINLRLSHSLRASSRRSISISPDFLVGGFGNVSWGLLVSFILYIFCIGDRGIKVCWDQGIVGKTTSLVHMVTGSLFRDQEKNFITCSQVHSFTACRLYYDLGIKRSSYRLIEVSCALDHMFTSLLVHQFTVFLFHMLT